jgi:hypothetical protein
MYNVSGTITKSTDDYRLLQKSNLEIKNVHGPLPTNGEGGIVEGTITMKHELTGGASSIVFQNKLRPRAFGTIEYHDSKLTSESMHLNYALGDSLNKEQSVFYIGTKTDESNDDTDDTMVIRSGKNLILDASRYTNTVANAPSTVENRVNEDNTVYIQPNGGFLTVGGNDQTTGNMEVWCNLIVRGTTEIQNNLTVNGDITASSFNAASDYRLKDQVQTLSGSYYTVDNIRPVHYILKDSQIPHMGFIAHEVQEHFPTMVSGEKDGEIMQTVNYSELIPVLVKEIQESKAREKEKNQEAIARDQEIAELKSSIQSLQQEFTRMHQLMRTMEEKLGRFSPR